MKQVVKVIEVFAPSNERLQDELNKICAEGWELVSYSYNEYGRYQCIFKQTRYEWKDTSNANNALSSP